MGYKTTKNNKVYKIFNVQQVVNHIFFYNSLSEVKTHCWHCCISLQKKNMICAV